MQAKRLEQRSHAGVGPQVGKTQIGIGVDRIAPGTEQFVFGIEQVEQSTLADVELIAVGIARLFKQADLGSEIVGLLLQALHVVIGDEQGLPGVAAGLFAQVESEVLALNVLLFASPVRPPLNRFQLTISSATL